MFSVFLPFLRSAYSWLLYFWNPLSILASVEANLSFKLTYFFNAGFEPEILLDWVFLGEHDLVQVFAEFLFAVLVFVHSQKVVVEGIIFLRRFLLNFEIVVFGRVVELPGDNRFGQGWLERTALLRLDFLLSIKLIVVNFDFVGIGEEASGVDSFLVSFEFVSFDIDFIKVEFMKWRGADILDPEGAGGGLIRFMFAVSTEFGLDFVSFLSCEWELLKCRRGKVKAWRFYCSFWWFRTAVPWWEWWRFDTFLGWGGFCWWTLEIMGE